MRPDRTIRARLVVVVGKGRRGARAADHLAVYRRHDRRQQRLVQSAAAAVIVLRRRRRDGGFQCSVESDDAVAFEAVHELMRHHAIRAQVVGAVVTPGHGRVLLALASLAEGAGRRGGSDRG